jgi:hypothetical protein
VWHYFFSSLNESLIAEIPLNAAGLAFAQESSLSVAQTNQGACQTEQVEVAAYRTRLGRVSLRNPAGEHRLRTLVPLASAVNST